MKTKYFSYCGIINFSITGFERDLMLIEKYLTLSTSKQDVDYSITMYKTPDLSNFKNIGNIIYPFKNCVYKQKILSEQNVIIYAEKQEFSDEHVIVRNNDIISIYSNSDDIYWYTIKMIDELIIRKLFDMGFFPLHASSVSDKNGSLVFVGYSGMGKSTSMYYYSMFENMNPQANDTVFVGRIGNEWHSFGIIEDATFGESLIKDKQPEERFGSKKVRFTPIEYEQYSNVKYNYMSKINNIVFVNLNQYGEYKEYTVEPSQIDLNMFVDKKLKYGDILAINNLSPHYSIEDLIRENQFYGCSGNILKKQSVRRRQNENML